MKSSFVIVALLSAFSLQAQTESPGQPARSVSPVNHNPPPLDPENMDTAVKPQDDFYLYANGGGLKRNPVPPEYARWGGFRELDERKKRGGFTRERHGQKNNRSGANQATRRRAKAHRRNQRSRRSVERDRPIAHDWCRRILRIWLRSGCKR